MLTINAELRKETGKSFSRKLRIHNKFQVFYMEWVTPIFY